MAECAVKTCEKPKYRHEQYCLNHWRRFKRYGDPLRFYDSYGDSLAERFWSQVNVTADERKCWVWTGRTERKGYGRKKFDGKYRLAHHIAWFLAYRTFPDDCLLHSCDNPPCVNPRHLSEGTHYDNVADRQKKRRQARGERIGKAKLTSSEVRRIRVELAKGRFQKDIAKDFHVYATTICNINTGTTWSHVK